MGEEGKREVVVWFFVDCVLDNSIGLDPLIYIEGAVLFQ
jgi:hypothetical protein